MHDIGKVGIPDHILLKPGKLSIEEFAIMKKHAMLGYQILAESQSEMLQVGAEIALSHHEKFDGSGYPHGLVGEEIPLFARIVAVADVYDALTSLRPYKRAMLHSESFEIIVGGSGNQFDPQIVEAFVRQESKFLEVLEQSHADIASDDETVPAIGRLQMSLSTVEWGNGSTLPTSVS